MDLTPHERAIIASTTEAALQRGAQALAEAYAEPGFYPTQEVREGLAYQLLRDVQRAHAEARVRDAAFVRALQEAPDEPTFLEPVAQRLEAPRTHGDAFAADLGGTTMLLDGMEVLVRTFPGPLWPWGEPQPVPVPGVVGRPPGDPIPPQEPAPPALQQGGLLDTRFLDPLPCGQSWGAQPDLDLVMEPCGDLADVSTVADVNLNQDDVLGFSAVAYPPLGRARCPLVLLLPGENDFVDSVAPIATAYARAGFRVLVVQRGLACTVRKTCAPQDWAMADDLSWNACVVAERLLRTVEIFRRVTEALLEAEAQDAAHEWGRFLDAGIDGTLHPRWSEILLAGYSEGANQTAFHLRFVQPMGAILYSGGGDGQRPAASPTGTSPCERANEDCRQVSPADWLSTSPLGGSVVGFRHIDEPCDFTEGWNLTGIPTEEVQLPLESTFAVPDPGDAARIARTDREAGDHGAAIQANNANMDLVHAHLLCKAQSGT